jgi:hypothetical protein
VHARAEEEKFAADGFGVERYPVTYNDIRLIDPKSNPAGTKGMEDVAEAFKATKAKATLFISRDDRPGTHAAEHDLWKARRHPSRQRQRTLVSLDGLRHGRGAEYGVERLCINQLKSDMVEVKTGARPRAFALTSTTASSLRPPLPMKGGGAESQRR